MSKSQIIKIILVACLLFLNCKIVVYAQEVTVCNNNVDEECTQNNAFVNEVLNERGKRTKVLLDVCGTIAIEIVGAFLGFLSAIAFANRSSSKQKMELDASLHDELKAIYDELSQRIQDEDFGDFYRYQIPIWEINLESGALALVTNNEVYNKYIKIYSIIKYAQELELEYIRAKLFANREAENDFANRYIKTIDEARRREAKVICEQITKEILKETNK